MGIFEQYGIKEIADVTLYAITQNKYGEEIYVPLIYFDTLKISDIEQAAEQISARGGLGNSHQIFWDYNKEVNIRLTDALYTPASQSLIWGNYLGIQPLKLKGVWTPETFQIQKKIVQEIPQGKENVYVKFICPCDNMEKYYTYEVKTIQAASQISQKDIDYRNNKIQLDGQIIQNVQTYTAASNNNKQYGELIIKNFSKFSQNYAQYSDSELISHWRLFNWSDCEGEIVTEQETVSTNNIDLAVFSNENTDNIMFLIRNFSQNEGGKEKWTSKLSVYKKIYKIMDGLGENNQPIQKTLSLQVHLGDFYIIEDWNINNDREESLPYKINLNYIEIPFLDSIKKFQAKKDFKIDTNKNILAYNAFFIKEYEKRNLTCYIDPKTMKPYSPNNAELKNDLPASYHYLKRGEYYLKKTRSQSSISKQFLQTLIKVNQFNGLFKIVGETYTRDRIGLDQHYQIEIPRCKMHTEGSLNLTADGEANTVNMTFTVLPSYDGKIVSITRYEEKIDDECNKKYTRPILTRPAIQPIPTSYHINVIYPSITNGGMNPGIVCIPNDCRVENSEAYINGGSRLILPKNQNSAQFYYQKMQNAKWDEIPKDLLLVGIYDDNNLVGFLTQNDDTTITIKNLEVE